MNAYMVSSGSYSDYYVACVFETREDAQKYAVTMSENVLRGSHDRYMNNHPTGFRGVANPHAGTFEECEYCKGFDRPDYHEYYVEEIQFYPAGQVPVVEQDG